MQLGEGNVKHAIEAAKNLNGNTALRQVGIEVNEYSLKNIITYVNYMSETNINFLIFYADSIKNEKIGTFTKVKLDASLKIVLQEFCNTCWISSLLDKYKTEFLKSFEDYLNSVILFSRVRIKQNNEFKFGLTEASF